MAETASVTIMLNRTGRFSDYSKHDELEVAIAFECDLPAARSIPVLLEQIWEQANIDHPRAEWAVEYRRRRNRSLSIGDVVIIGETAWSPQTVGWQRVFLPEDGLGAGGGPFKGLGLEGE